MSKINKNRKIKYDESYKPVITNIGDEIYPNGIFHFNISRILEHIMYATLIVEEEKINVKEWFKLHFHGEINEEHLQKVDTRKTVIQAEIRPDRFEIIDGNHRLERAYREGIEYINSYKLKAEQLLPYFVDVRGYKTFVEYWNSKL